MAPSPSMSSSLKESRDKARGVVDSKILRNASQAMEGRARHQLEVHNHPHQSNVGVSGHHEIHLPPIDPPTPSVGNARKFLNRDDAQKANKKLGMAFMNKPSAMMSDKEESVGAPPNCHRTDSEPRTDTSRSGEEGKALKNRTVPLVTHQGVPNHTLRARGDIERQRGCFELWIASRHNWNENVQECTGVALSGYYSTG